MATDSEMRSEVVRALKVMTTPGQTIELRAVGVSKSGEKAHIESRLFTDRGALADEAVALTRHAKGVYITLNPVKEGTNGSAADADIERRVWFPVDVDPQREEKSSSSSDAEHTGALTLAGQIRDFLASQGWPAPVEGDSGNGAHLLWKIDLPNDDESKALVEGALKALDFLFSEEKQQVDTGNFNAARIWKLYGTLARKGEDTPERPHRMARLVHVPERTGLVTREQLEQLTAMLPSQSKAAGGQESNGGALDLQGFFKKYDIAVASVKKSKDYTVFRLTTCPWCDEHSDGDDGAAVMQFANGAVEFKCHHSHCEGRTWRDFRAFFEPEYGQRRSLVTYEDMEIPPGYNVGKEGVAHLKSYRLPSGDVAHHPELIAAAPIYITGRLLDVDTGEESLRLVWLRGGARQLLVVSRGKLMDARGIVELASVGFPVNSATAQEVVKYITAFEARNIERLPVEKVSSHLGWMGEDGEHGFLCGRELIAAEETRPVAFKGASGGDEQVADGYRTSGTLDGWIAGISVVKDYPTALVDLYAAFVPPLLRIFRCSNFTVDTNGRTSTGKSTIMRLGASAVGDPERIIHSWDTTRVGFERLASMNTDLPLFLDDTKQVKRPEAVGEVLYDHGNGRGRGRGNKDGLAQSATWRSVLQSTGEGAAVEYTKDAGVRGRVLTFKGMPFGSDNAREVVEQLNATVAQHYGHAFPLFVRYVVKHRAEWERWKSEYETLKAGFARDAKTAVAGRLAAYMAAVAYTAQLVHKAFAEAGHPLEWEYNAPLVTAWKAAAAETGDAAVDIRALRDVYYWACQNRHNFWNAEAKGKEATYQYTPNGGWLGRWDDGDNWASITFQQLPLKQFLLLQGYRPDEVFDGWKTRGWLALDASGKNKLVRIGDGGAPVRCVVLRREIFTSVEELDEAA